MKKPFGTFRDKFPDILPPAQIEESKIKKFKREVKKIPVPISPVIQSALRAIYGGGPKNLWSADSYGRPFFKYGTRVGDIIFTCAPPPDFGSRFNPAIAMYYTPRLGFAHSGALRNLIRNLSVETADVFLILMSRIAELKNPRDGIARISLDEMAKLREVRIRHGSSRNLYEDFKQEILRLADLRLTMSWKDYKTGGDITFGRERPDRLLDIIDIEYKRGSETWTAFRFRCGQALSHFLDPEGLFWIGYYSKALLHLSPYHEAFTKKLGTYWILIGTISEKKGLLPRATPRTIMDFCGEKIHWRNPGQTVDAFIEAHQRLEDLGVLEEIPILEPPARGRGYFNEWLDTVLTVKLSEDLWKIRDSRGKGKLRLSGKGWLRKRRKEKKKITQQVPKTIQELRADHRVIKRLRTEHAMRQPDLARALGITRQTLSNYERGLRTIPENKALKFLQLWHNRPDLDESKE